MKRFFLWSIAMGMMFGLVAQVAPSKYFIQFTDKANTTFTLSNPGVYLTQRSLDRRAAQGYLIDSLDIPVNQHYIDSVLAKGNITLLTRSKWLNGITVYSTDIVALSAVLALPFVEGINPVAKNALLSHADKFADVELSPLQLDNSSSTVKSGKALNYGASANQIEMIGLDFLHSQGYTGDGMMIAVLDAGFFSVDTFTVFDSIRSSGRILGTRDFVLEGGNVYDSHTHGMMVLSIMGGHVPGQLVGTSPHAAFWLLRSEDGPTEYVIEEYNWVSAAEFADSVGADIINSSLGYSEFDDPSQNHVFADMDGQTTVVTRGADIAASRGILVVNSAGNSAQSPWQRIIAPGDADSVLTIGAVDQDEIYAPFSSVGYTYDGRVKPDVVAQGANTVVASSQGGIMTGNGTSFSSPVMAGAAACLWQANPLANNMQIMEAIKQSANQYNNPDSLLGYGIPNFMAAHLLLAGVLVDETLQSEYLNIFPNPLSDNLNIVYVSNDTQSVNFEFYDMNGKLVLSHENTNSGVGYNSMVMQLPNSLVQGFYFLRISFKERVVLRKLVKIS